MHRPWCRVPGGGGRSTEPLGCLEKVRPSAEVTGEGEKRRKKKKVAWFLSSVLCEKEEHDGDDENL